MQHLPGITAYQAVVSLLDPGNPPIPTCTYLSNVETYRHQEKSVQSERGKKVIEKYGCGTGRRTRDGG
jgi:hypothetical protein